MRSLRVVGVMGLALLSLPVVGHERDVAAGGLPSFHELRATEQHLLGTEGSALYARLTAEQKAVFLLVVRRLEQNGISLQGLAVQRPSDVRPNVVHLSGAAQALRRLELDLKEGVSTSRFQRHWVFAPFHPGRARTGFRENRRRFALQVGIGPLGAFADIDNYNPLHGLGASLGHLGEIVVPGKPAPFYIARILGEDLSARSP